MKNHKGVKIDLLRIEGDQKTSITDWVAREIDLTIFVNQQWIATLPCSPGNLKYLGVGFLITTGILRMKEDLISVKIQNESIFIDVKNPSLPVNELIGSLKRRINMHQQFQSGNRSISVLDKQCKIPASTIFSLVSAMQEMAVFFQQSGGVHSCALTDTNGSILLFCEDISRYNTIDRIFGEAFFKKMNTDDKIILTSCRITSGIIGKVLTGNIPIIISRSAPTDCAIKLAHQKGITLIGFVRGTRMNIYTHPFRVEI